jgi:hypothetical protein
VDTLDRTQQEARDLHRVEQLADDAQACASESPRGQIQVLDEALELLTLRPACHADTSQDVDLAGARRLRDAKGALEVVAEEGASGGIAGIAAFAGREVAHRQVEQIDPQATMGQDAGEVSGPHDVWIKQLDGMKACGRGGIKGLQPWLPWEQDADVR